MSRYPREIVCRADDRGVVHYALKPGDLQKTLHTPALCEQFVDQRLVMTKGPSLEAPTCLWCVASVKGWR